MKLKKNKQDKKIYVDQNPVNRHEKTLIHSSEETKTRKKKQSITKGKKTIIKSSLN